MDVTDPETISLWVGRFAPVSATRVREEVLAHCAEVGLLCTIEERRRLLDTKLTMTVCGPQAEVERLRDLLRGNCFSITDGA